MKDLDALTATAKSMFAEIKCQHGKFSICSSNRLTRNWGYCRRIRGRGKPRFSITIAEVLLGDDVPDISTLSTITHEILHTVDGCLNHGWKWRILAARLNEHFGLKIKRLTSAEEKGEAVSAAINGSFKYRAYCPNCGREWKRHHYSRLIAKPYEFNCPTCKCALSSERIQMA